MENNIWYSNCWTNEVDTHNNTGQTYGGSRSNMLHFCTKMTHYICQLLHSFFLHVSNNVQNITLLFKNIN